MFHPILDVGNKLNWDSVIRQKYWATALAGDTFAPIPDKTFLVSGNLFLIGCKNDDAKPKWFLGCRASQLLLASPTTYQPEFLDLVQTDTPIPIPLNRWRLVRFTNYGLTPYLLNISIASWHRQLYLEIWQYSGVDSDSVEAKLDALT